MTTRKQIAVLKALEPLKPGQGLTAKQGGFSSNAASSMLYGIVPDMRPAVSRDFQSPRRWELTAVGRAHIATLKAEGRW